MGLISRTKNNPLPLLKQIIDLIPGSIINNAVAKFETDKHCRTYKTYDQFVSMLFGQLNRCLTLRDISLGLGINSAFLSDMGLEQNPAKSTMSNGNKKRNWMFSKKFSSKQSTIMAICSRILPHTQPSKNSKEKRLNSLIAPQSAFVWECSTGRSFGQLKAE